jgi:Tfp pilus assembly protein PilZ
MTKQIEDRRSAKRRPYREGRRRYPRVRLSLQGFYTSDDRALFLSSRNVNLRGVFVPTTVPDGIGSRAILHIEAPGSAAMLKIPARVVWSNEDPQKGPLGMGLRFEGLSGWRLKRIASLLIKRAGLGALSTAKIRF